MGVHTYGDDDARLSSSSSFLRHIHSLTVKHKNKQLRAAEGRIAKLESQLEEAKRRWEQASRAERETRAMYARREAAFDRCVSAWAGVGVWGGARGVAVLFRLSSWSFRLFV